MTLWTSYWATASWLRTLISGVEAVVDPDLVQWEDIAREASTNMVTPALAWALQDHPEVPEDFRDYLSAILELTRERNARIADELELLLKALNAAGIVPVLLKGAGGLATDLYPDIGLRIFCDLDLLVPERQIEPAARTLEAIGFTGEQPDRKWIQVREKQLPMKIHPNWPAGVELHRYVTDFYGFRLVPTEGCFKAAEPVRFRGYDALMPGATDQVAHNIAHAQVGDGWHRRGVPRLRQLLDLAMLRARHGGNIDWDEIARRFRKAGHGPALHCNLAAVEGLLGQPVPADMPKMEGYMEQLRQRVENYSWSRSSEARHLLTCYAARLRARPLSVLNAFQPAGWSSRMPWLRRSMRR